MLGESKHTHPHTHTPYKELNKSSCFLTETICKIWSRQTVQLLQSQLCERGRGEEEELGASRLHVGRGGPSGREACQGRAAELGQRIQRQTKTCCHCWGAEGGVKAGRLNVGVSASRSPPHPGLEQRRAAVCTKAC